MSAWSEGKAERARIPATEAQIRAVERHYGADAARNLSMNRAIELLSVRDYVRGAAHIYLERQNGIRIPEDRLRAACVTICADPKLREFIEKWAQRRFFAGTMGDLPTRLRMTPELQAVVNLLCESIGAKATWHDR